MNQLQSYYKRRHLLVELFGGKCVRCGFKNNLQFDHIYPKEKAFTISNYLSYKIQTILKELSKCQLLCIHCHKEKNKIDIGEAKHGTYFMYRRYKCRCRPCMDSYNIIRKKWRGTALKKGKKW